MEFQSFLNHLESLRNCSPQTLKAYESDLKMLAAFMHERSVNQLSEIDHAFIKEYISHMQQKNNPRFDRTGLAPSSIGRRLAVVSSYFEFVRATSDIVLRNPLNEYMGKWQKNNEPKPVDDMTLDLLISGMTNIRDRTMFTLFLSTGLRISELHQLDRTTIVIEAEEDPTGQEHFYGCGEVVGKGSKRRKFYVDEGTLDLYAQYLGTRTDDNPALFLSERKQRISVRAIQYALGAWCTRLGAPHINVHRLRHSYATRLANANISSMVLRDLLGHSSFATTQRYFKLTDNTMARGYFSAMEYLRG